MFDAYSLALSGSEAEPSSRYGSALEGASLLARDYVRRAVLPLKNRLRLIGGFQTLFAFPLSSPAVVSGVPVVPGSASSSPRPLFLGLYDPESAGSIASVDMVRLKLKVSDGEALESFASACPSDTLSLYSRPGGPGSYRFLYTFGWRGSSSLTLGIGLTGANGKPDLHDAFLEWNPNKTWSAPGFWRTLDRLRFFVSRAELARFDFAFDVPVPRPCYRLARDRRMYHFVQYSALTEYLGRKNTPGYCKLYDKAAELGLNYPATRLELSCSGEWSPSEVLQHWPGVYGFDPSFRPEFDGTQGGALLFLLHERLAAGLSVEDVLQPLRSSQRKKLRAALASAPFPVPSAQQLLHVHFLAHSWCSLLS